VTDSLERRFTEKVLAARSAAYQWLWTNRSEITAVLSRHARKPWLALAKTAAEEGKPFTPPALRMAWKRLERDLARAGLPESPPKPEPPPRVPAPQTVPSPQRPPEPPAAPPADLPDDEEEIEIPSACGTKTHTVRIPKNR
jgi:hypothetical protein